MPDALTRPNDSSSAGLAAQIETRYQCKLSNDLVDWFDRDIWKQKGTGEFCDAIDPSQLLLKTPDVIWPGLMPCDFLPLIGNDAGDWLGVRVNKHNQASEIMHWYHGGGDWIPWGRTLAEAVLFASVSDRLPGPHRRHAIPAEPVQQTTAGHPWLAWALSHLPDPLQRVTDGNLGDQALADLLLKYSVAEVAVRCELTQHALDESLFALLTTKAADEIHVPRDHAVEWAFDIGRLPSEVSEQLKSKFGWQNDGTQDWQTAAKHCLAVTNVAPELGWAWDVLGYSFERAGNTTQAVAHYREAAMRSVFTDQSIRLRTHWESARSPKFSVARLMRLDSTVVESDAYLRRLVGENADTRRVAVTEYWLNEAAKSSDQPSVGLNHLVAAGWDLGAEPMSGFGDIMQRIVETADAANQVARARVAETHRECLKERYGV